MGISINQWLSTAFNAAVPSEVLLLTVAGGKKEVPQTFFSLSYNLTQGQEAEMPMTKNIFDMLNKKETVTKSATVASKTRPEANSNESHATPYDMGTESAIAASYSAEEISQEAYPVPVNHITIWNEQSKPTLNKANALADVEALIVDAPNKPVKDVPADSVFIMSKLPDIQIKDPFIPYFSDIPEQKNDPLPDPQDGKSGKNNPTYQGLVSPLEKPIERQNTLYTNTLFASDKRPLMVMRNDKTVEPLEINLLNTLQKGNNKDSQPSPAASAPNEQKHNLAFPLPKAVEMASETNNKLSLLNQLQQEIHTTEPKITVKDTTNQNVVTGDDTVRASDVIGNDVNDKTKPPLSIIPLLNINTIKPQNTTLPSQPVDKQIVMLQDTPTEHTSAKEHAKNIQPEKPDMQLKVNESNMNTRDPVHSEADPLRRVAGQNQVTQSIDSRIHTNAQMEGQHGTESGYSSQHEDPEQTETAPAESERITNSQNPPPSDQETKVVDLSKLKAKTTPDEQHKNLSANLITNEQNDRITALSPEGFDRQSVKDVPKSNNPHQITESYYDKIIEQIAQKVLVMGKGRSDIKLRLEPPELGHINLKLSVTGNRLEASIEVENLNIMHAIERDIPHLKESISSAGIDVGKLDVLCREGNDGHHGTYLTEHTNLETQNLPEEDTDIETVEKMNRGFAVTGINNALDIGRIDYIA